VKLLYFFHLLSGKILSSENNNLQEENVRDGPVVFFLLMAKPHDAIDKQGRWYA